MKEGQGVSVITKNGNRYEGTLKNIEPETVTVGDVRSYGTEKRAAATYAPASDQVFEYMVFKSADICDLSFFTRPPQVQDPAIVSAGRAVSPPLATTSGYTKPQKQRKQHDHQPHYHHQPHEAHHHHHHHQHHHDPSAHHGSKGKKGGGSSFLFDPGYKGGGKGDTLSSDYYGKGGKDAHYHGDFKGGKDARHKGGKDFGKGGKHHHHHHHDHIEHYHHHHHHHHNHHEHMEGYHHHHHGHHGKGGKKGGKGKSYATHTGMEFKDQKKKQKEVFKSEFDFAGAGAGKEAKNYDKGADEESKYTPTSGFYDSLGNVEGAKQERTPKKQDKAPNSHKTDCETFGAQAVEEYARKGGRGKGKGGKGKGGARRGGRGAY